MLVGLIFAYPKLHLHANHRVVQQKKWRPEEGRVALITGGGSGHEPFCAGYVGRGMLTAVAAGSVFTSPPTSSVLHAIRCVTADQGALVIIANYTGDCLNFGLAVEQAKIDGLKVETVVVGEDCALQSTGHFSRAGQRGMCGLLFVYKIAGALSERGASLETIASTAQEVCTSMATIGIALSACSLPGAGPLFTLKADEMELGLGVHGEAGIQRMKLCSAEKAVSLLLDRLIGALDLRKGDEVAVLINNLGGTSQSEQWVVCREVYSQLAKWGISACRMYAGLLMTSLEMAGIQVSVLKLSGNHRDSWLEYLDADTEAPAWPGNSMSIPSSGDSIPEESDSQTSLKIEHKIVGPKLNKQQGDLVKHILQSTALALTSSESRLNQLDSVCGDGDCGSTLRRFAQGVLTSQDVLEISYPAVLLHELANIAESSMGGTSGAIYSLMLTTAATALAEVTGDISGQSWALVWRSGLDGVMKYSQAWPGDRTMLDALLPACTQFENHSKETTAEIMVALKAAVEAATEGCNSTKDMEARVGRASYVNKDAITDVDAGAYGVTVWLQTIYNELQKCYG